MEFRWNLDEINVELKRNLDEIKCFQGKNRQILDDLNGI